MAGVSELKLTPFQYGEQMARNGFPVDRCPYQHGTEQARQWRHGWNAQRRRTLKHYQQDGNNPHI